MNMKTAFEIFRTHWKNHKSDKELLLSTADQNMIESAMEEYANQFCERLTEEENLNIRLNENFEEALDILKQASEIIDPFYKDAEGNINKFLKKFMNHNNKK